MSRRRRPGLRSDRVLAVFGYSPGACYVEATVPAAALTSAALTAAASIGASTITVNAQLAVKTRYIIDSETVTINSMSGTASPYTANLAAPLTAAHASATPIKTVEFDYTLLKPIGAGRYAYWTLPWLTKNPPYATGTVSGYGLNQLHNAGTALTAIRVARDDASITRTGSWTTGVQSLSFGGGYRWSATLNNTVSWTTPAGSTRIAVEGTGDNASYCGLAIVSIDGDKTAATGLLTAQAGVTAGIFPSTLLAANGGPAQPTDRIFDCYQPALVYNHRVLLVDGLAGAAHSVVLTVTGLADARKPAGTRVAYSALAAGSAASALTDANAAPFPELATQDSEFVSSAWERADQEAQPGGTQTFIGDVHGYERQTSIAFMLAGATVSPAANTISAVDTAVRASTTNHPDAVGTDTATCVTTYSLGPRGLTVQDIKTLLVSLVISYAYMMLPSNGVSSSSQPYNRTAGENTGPGVTLPGTADAQFTSGHNASQWVWSTTGKLASMIQMLDAAAFTAAWAETGAGAYVQDRTGQLTKVYRPWKINASTTVAAGTVKTRRALYLIGYFANGSDTVLSKL